MFLSHIFILQQWLKELVGIGEHGGGGGGPVKEGKNKQEQNSWLLLHLSVYVRKEVCVCVYLCMCAYVHISKHVETYQERSSDTTHQGTLIHSCLSSPSHCEPILFKNVELVCAS